MSDIRVVDVHKAFGETRALDGVNLHVKAGEVHAIVGENGCGKSTLAKVLSGIHSVDKGEVSIFGQRATDPISARRIGIATIFQEILVAEEASVLENLFVGVDPLWRRALSEADKRRTAAELMLKFTGEAIDLDSPVRHLPLSVKQWIVICRALIGEPRVLIFDESSAALDLDATAKLHAEMRRLRDRGACVIIVTHRIAELVRIADRATILRDGCTVGELAKEEITESNLLALMTGHARASASIVKPKSRVAANAKPVLFAKGVALNANAKPFEFSLGPGEIVGVTGLDGAGQDQFVRGLAGIVRPAVGQVQVKQAESWVSVEDQKQAAKLRIAFVSGDRKREGIFPNLSIFENLAIGLYNMTSNAGGWLNQSRLDVLFGKEVDRFAVRMGDRDNRITSLSGGNQQKILISRALASEPRIIVLNDPARGVDVGTKSDLHRELKAFVAAGGAVVYLSSELEEFFGFADRVSVFYNQSVFATLSGENINEKSLLPAMFGHTWEVDFDAMVTRAA